MPASNYRGSSKRSRVTHLSRSWIREWPSIILTVLAFGILMFILMLATNNLGQIQLFDLDITEFFKNQQFFGISTIIILLLSSMIHSASGFGFALFMMPLLVWNGFSLAQASIFTATSGFVLSCLMVYQLREHVQWKLLWPTLIPRVGGLMIGIFILTFLNSLDKALIRQFLGAALLLTVIIQIAVNVKPRDHVHRGWFWGALGSGGILNGLVGFGGPPVVLWVMAHNWSKQQIRAFLAAIYWTIIPVQIILLLVTFGQPLVQFSLQAVIYIPLVVIGVLAGVWLGGFLNKARLRRFVQVLLILTAVWSIVAPYVLASRI